MSPNRLSQPPSGPRICLVTTSQPSANPRLVKEADALSQAGYDVRVVGAHLIEWADAFDEELLRSRRWRCDILDWRRATHPWRFWKSRGRHFIARRLAPSTMLQPFVDEAALSRVGPDLYAPAKAERADLFIAHNLGALPAAIAAGRHFGVPVGFDAEDFHSGQLFRTEEEDTARLTRRIERALLPRCAYVTAGSPGIAEAYERLCGIPRPTCILNTFPLADRPTVPRAVRAGAATRLHWFSQTIGSARGLECVLRAMALLREHHVELHLRGRWHAGYETALRGLMTTLDVPQDRLVSHEPAPPWKLAALSSEFDIGLAVEPTASVNSDILLPNKIFTYLLAGIAVVATNTTGQRWLADQLPGAVALCDVDDPHSMAEALLPWVTSHTRLEHARAHAWNFGSHPFNWDVEQAKLLQVVSDTLALN